MFSVAENYFLFFFVCCCFSQKLAISLTYQSIKNNKVMAKKTFTLDIEGHGYKKYTEVRWVIQYSNYYMGEVLFYDLVSEEGEELRLSEYEVAKFSK